MAGSLGLNVALKGKLDEIYNAELKAVSDGVARAVDRAVSRLKRDERSAIKGIKLGVGLSKSVRSVFYRNQGYDAAGIVHVKGKGARKIFRLASKGGAVRPKGKWLAIPLRGAGKRSRVDRRRRPRPEDFADAKNVTTIPIKGGAQFLMVRKTKTRSVPLFLFARVTRHTRRLDLHKLAVAAADRLPGEILQELPA